jgi:hypothetical protein
MTIDAVFCVLLFLALKRLSHSAYLHILPSNGVSKDASIC